MSKDNFVFKDKTFEDLLEECYNNKRRKDVQIDTLIQELQPLVGDEGANATLVVPLIKSYLDSGMKNDDNWIKVMAIVQRYITKTEDGTGKAVSASLSEEDRKELLKMANKLREGDNQTEE